MKRILIAAAAVLTLALAGCGGGAPTVQQTQAAQAQQITAIQGQLATMQQTVTAQQLAKVKEAVDASNADAGVKAQIDRIIDASTGAQDIRVVVARFKVALAADQSLWSGWPSSMLIYGVLSQVLAEDTPLEIAQEALWTLQTAANDLQQTQAAHAADPAVTPATVAADESAISYLAAQVQAEQATVTTLTSTTTAN